MTGPWFAGESFGLADAAFGPVFRYLEVFDERLGHSLIRSPDNVRRWARGLAERPSVRTAVAPDYADRLIDFVAAKGSYLAGLLEQHALEIA